MIAIAPVVVAFYPPIAGVFLIIGLSLLWRGAYLDRKYGKNRPSRTEIDIMPVADYKKRILNDSEFRRWVNHLYKKPVEKPFRPDDF